MNGIAGREGAGFAVPRGLVELQEKLACSVGRLRTVLRYCRTDAMLVEGKERHSGRTMRVFYAGKMSDRQWILNLIFSGYDIQEVERNILPIRIGRRLRENEGKSDLAVVDLGGVFGRISCGLNGDCLRMPDFILQKRDLPVDRQQLEESFREHRRHKYVNRILKQNITYRITDGESDFLKFYRSFYLPFITSRFGDIGKVEREESFLRLCRNGKVMKILLGSEEIAYAFLRPEDRLLHAEYLGIAPSLGGEEHKLVFNALYYYSILYAFENGYESVCFMESRPLLNDGVYLFKRMWGAEVYVPSGPRGVILLKPANFSEPVVRMFSGNHFITNGGGRFVAKVLCGEEGVSREFVEDLMKKYYSRGIDAVRVYSLGKVSPDVAAWARENAPPVEIVDLSGEKNPHETFCR